MIPLIIVIQIKDLMIHLAHTLKRVLRLQVEHFFVSEFQQLTSARIKISSVMMRLTM